MKTLGGLLRAVPEKAADVEKVVRRVLRGDRSAVVLLADFLFFFKSASAEDIQTIRTLVAAMRVGHLALSAEFVSVPPPVEQEFEDVKYHTGRVVESAEHRGMRLWVRQFLETKGLCVEGDRLRSVRPSVDVGCLKCGTTVWCGEVLPANLVRLLTRSLRVGLLRFNSEEILWFEPKAGFRDLMRNRTSIETQFRIDDVLRHLRR